MKQAQLKWQREGYTSQSSYHRAKKRARGQCIAHGCTNQARVKVTNGKAHVYVYCAKHSTRKSRGFE